MRRRICVRQIHNRTHPPVEVYVPNVDGSVLTVAPGQTLSGSDPGRSCMKSLHTPNCVTSRTRTRCGSSRRTSSLRVRRRFQTRPFPIAHRSRSGSFSTNGSARAGLRSRGSTSTVWPELTYERRATTKQGPRRPSKPGRARPPSRTNRAGRRGREVRMRVPITACQEPASHHLRPPLALRVDIVGTVDHNMDERGIPTTPSAHFPRAPNKEGSRCGTSCSMPREGAYEEAWILPPRSSHAYLRNPLGACIDPLFRLPPRPRRRPSTTCRCSATIPPMPSAPPQRRARRRFRRRRPQGALDAHYDG